MLYIGIKGDSSKPILKFSRKFLPTITWDLGLLETSFESPP